MRTDPAEWRPRCSARDRLVENPTSQRPRRPLLSLSFQEVPTEACPSLDETGWSGARRPGAGGKAWRAEGRDGTQPRGA